MDSIRNFARRHRRKFFVTAGIAGIAYFAGQYVLSKMSEMQDRMSGERTAREDLRRRFEQNQQDCSITVAALLPEMSHDILDELPVERITNELKRGNERAEGSEMSSREDDTQSIRSASSEQTHASSALPHADGERKKSKAVLWNELKIHSLTRTLTLIYSLALLVLFTRVQMNLLGRIAYVNSVISFAGKTDEAITLQDSDSLFGRGEDFELSRKYLLYSWWLLNHGWRTVMGRVQAAVEAVLGPLTLRTQLTLEEYKELVSRVRQRVEGDGESPYSWLPSLLPDASQEARVLEAVGASGDVDHGLRRLLDETRDLIESPNANVVMSKMVDAEMDLLVSRKLALSTFDNGPAKLASIAAAVSREAHLVANSIPNDYSRVLEDIHELQAFSAIIYSNFGNASAPLAKPINGQ